MNLKQNQKKKNDINNNNNLIDCESGRINEDLKSMMSSSANTKNTYVNYEKKSNKIIINKTILKDIGNTLLKEAVLFSELCLPFAYLLMILKI